LDHHRDFGADRLGELEDPLMSAVLRRQEGERVKSVTDGRTLIVGLGATGLATARYLARHGCDLLVIDSRRSPPGLAALQGELPEVPVSLGTLGAEWLRDVSRVVLSPGLASGIELVAEARRRGIPIVGDVEIFARAAQAPIIAVTGSNGKSTVTTLVAELLRAKGLESAAGGNLGPPCLELLGRRADVYVLEISSFQMETTEHLRALAATVLNVSPDHLDRHGSLERYASLKAKLLTAAAHAVYNHDDPIVRAMGLTHPHAVAFSVAKPLANGYSVIRRGAERWLARDGAPLLPSRALRLRGIHNEANALAAMALASFIGGESTRVLEVLRAFRGLPHRCEVVGERSGVTFINDSKGTNVGATIAALEGLAGPLILIAGGIGKGADFGPLAQAGKGKLKAAVLIGEAADEMARVLRPVCDVEKAGGMEEAVRLAGRTASAGDTVLLSPACASQDMFADYRQRGDAFAAAVRSLTE
jgi:UDP-N-acetylmuramoylalanine--D-glutamate ligase